MAGTALLTELRRSNESEKIDTLKKASRRNRRRRRSSPSSMKRSLLTRRKLLLFGVSRTLHRIRSIVPFALILIPSNSSLFRWNEESFNQELRRERQKTLLKRRHQFRGGISEDNDSDKAAKRLASLVAQRARRAERYRQVRQSFSYRLV